MRSSEPPTGVGGSPCATCGAGHRHALARLTGSRPARLRWSVKADCAGSRTALTSHLREDPLS